MSIQRLHRENVPAFEADQFLADIVRGYVEVGNCSLQNEIDDRCLCFVVAHANNTFLNGTCFAADCVRGSARWFENDEHGEPTRWTRMTTLKGLGARFITWKSGADPRKYFSNFETDTIPLDIPIHRKPDIRDEHTSMDMLSNTAYR